MAIEILKAKRSELRQKARFYNRNHNDGEVSVRTWNTLLQCAHLTVAILVLKHGGVA